MHLNDIDSLNTNLVLGKFVLLHEVSSLIRLSIARSLIRDETFRLKWICAKMRLPLNENVHQSGKSRLCDGQMLIWDNT